MSPICPDRHSERVRSESILVTGFQGIRLERAVASHSSASRIASSTFSVSTSQGDATY